MAKLKQSPVRATKLEFDDKSALIVPAENDKDGSPADATLVFHTTGGDQKIEVKIVGWKQLKDKARITIMPV